MTQMLSLRLFLGMALYFCIFGNFASVSLIIEGSLAVPKGVARPTTYSDLTGNEQVKFNRLVSWITENGGFVDPRGVLATSNKSGYRGMFAVEDIPKDTILARIPPGAILRDSEDMRNWVSR